MNKLYASLHNHTMHSFQDGLGNAEQWIKSAIEKGISGLGVTNHGSTGDLMEFYRLGKKYKYPIVLGTEFYVTQDHKQKDKNNKYAHLNLWGKNEIGYKNLCVLNTLSWTEDRFYYKPRIDFQDLEKYSEGLICGSACVGGLIAKTFDYVKVQPTEQTYQIIEFLKNIFDEDFYLEIQPADISYNWNRQLKQFIKQYDINPQELINRFYQDVSKKYNIKIIATTDAHMLDKKDKLCQDVQIKNSPGNKDGWHFYETYYLPTYDEFLEIWKEKHSYVFKNDEIYKYLENTLEVLDKCKNLELNFSPLLPDMKIKTDSTFLYRILKKEGRIDLNNIEIKNRIDSEINTLCHNGKVDLTNYFLLLYDLICWCRDNDIMVGPGRGSACGSLLAYGLNITKIDPIKWDLSFERFINETRIKENTLPDIDLDFSNPVKVKEYLFEKYGQEYIASIGTIQTLKLRSALKDTLRILEPELSSYDLNRITKYIDENKGQDLKQYFLTQISKNKELKNIVLQNKDIAKVAFNLIGQARQRGTHAAAVVISPIPIKNIIPLALNKGSWVTQYSMEDIEFCGLIKYDILGLNTLNDIQYCLKLIKESRGINLTIDEIIEKKNNDRKVFEQFEKGNTYSVFQFNTDVAISICTKMSINSIDDLAKITALGRPGTLSVGMHNVYIKRQNKESTVKYIHDSVKDILEPTKGIMLYQEQVMKVFQKLGGFNSVEADEVRRGMGKKKYKLLEKYKEKFIKNSLSNYDDIDKNKAEKIWGLIEANSDYLFNKSHAVAYAFLAYICQYLKTYYSLEWWCSVLKHESNDDKLAEMYHILNDILILPDINKSKTYFYIDGKKIIMPLSYIMNLGDKAVKEIIRKQPYDNLEHFVKKVDRKFVRKDIVVNLIFAGAFNKIEKERGKKLIYEYYRILASNSTKGESRKLLSEYRDKYEHITRFELLKLENSVLPGCSENYIDFFKDMLSSNVQKISEILEKSHNSKVVTAGLIKKIKTTLTKNNKTMCFLTIEDGNNDLAVILWEEQYNKHEDLLIEDTFIQISGKINIWQDRFSVVANNLKTIEI